MQQVLFRIPFPGVPEGIPIYGFGAMLFLAFIAGTWLAARRAQKEGLRKEYIQDLAMWLLVGGIVGARLSSVLLEAWKTGNFGWHLIGQFFRIWDGGLILYGAIIGGILGYALGYRFVIRKYGLSTWRLADIVAPSLAVGVCCGLRARRELASRRWPLGCLIADGRSQAHITFAMATPTGMLERPCCHFPGS